MDSSTGYTAVDFSERFRFVIPTISQYVEFTTGMGYVGVAALPGWSGGISGIAYNPRDNRFYAAQDNSQCP